MPEALARSHNDSILTGPARKSPRKARQSLARSAMRAFLSRPARTIAGATLAAVMTGIVINALLMQKERHSAPFFGPARPATVTAAAPPPAAAPVSSISAAAPAPATESAPVVAQPPARPTHLGAGAEPAAPPQPPAAPHSGDPIRDLLRGDAAKETSHLILAAQNALLRLGYVVKPDGAPSAATTKAIEMFERAHGMTPSSEVTAKLVRQLNAAVAAEQR